MTTTELIEMINKSDTFATFCLEDNDMFILEDEELLKKFIIKAYVGIRLQPILQDRKIDKKNYNYICDLFTEHFLSDNISLDILINCVYNYININNKCPSQKTFSDIQAFLEDYNEE